MLGKIHEVWKDHNICTCINLNYVKNRNSFLDDR